MFRQLLNSFPDANRNSIVKSVFTYLNSIGSTWYRI